MKNTAQKLILISFILSLIAAITVFLYLKSLKSTNEIDKKIKLIVATETIPQGTLLEKKMIKEVEMGDNSIWGDYIKDSSEIIGKYAKETIVKNEGFLMDKLLDKSGDELSLKIDSDHRALSISVTGDSGVSDLLKPGDYVDVILYMSEKRDGAKVVSPDIAKIILQNIELLAVDKQLKREEKTNDKSVDKDKILTNFLVTLSVKTEDLEKLVLAESMGSIKLALRPLKDENVTETTGITLKEMYVDVDSESLKDFTEQKNTSNMNNINNVSNDNSINDNSINDNNGKKENTSDEKYTEYTIQYGDTLKNISLKFYGDKSKSTIIKEANNIKDENLILEGEVIKIPILD